MKAPQRVRIFHEFAPNLSLPPEPILTRWGTWISAAEYYAANYEHVTHVLDLLPDDGSVALTSARQLVTNPSLSVQLAQITAHFGVLAETIKQLETQGLALEKSLIHVDTIHARLTDINCPQVLSALHKLEDSLGRNPGYTRLREINSLLLNSRAELSSPPALSPLQIAAFKFAPITNCDVERSFSKFSALFSDRRHQFLFDHLAQHFFLYCNSPSARPLLD